MLCSERGSIWMKPSRTPQTEIILDSVADGVFTVDPDFVIPFHYKVKIPEEGFFSTDAPCPSYQVPASIDVEEVLIGITIQLKGKTLPRRVEVSQIAFPRRQPLKLDKAVVHQIILSFVFEHNPGGFLEWHGNKAVIGLWGFFDERGAEVPGFATASISEKITQRNHDCRRIHVIVIDFHYNAACGYGLAVILR